MSRAKVICRAIDAPSWLSRMQDKMFLRLNQDCRDGGKPDLPVGFNRFYGCYRLQGHTGRHLGIITVRGNGDKDAWAVWP